MRTKAVPLTSRCVVFACKSQLFHCAQELVLPGDRFLVGGMRLMGLVVVLGVLLCQLSARVLRSGPPSHNVATPTAKSSVRKKKLPPEKDATTLCLGWRKVRILFPKSNVCLFARTRLTLSFIYLSAGRSAFRATAGSNARVLCGEGGGGYGERVW